MHDDVVVRAAADLHHPRRRQLNARGGLAVHARYGRVRVDVAPAVERRRPGRAGRRVRRRLGGRFELEPEHRPVLRVADVDHARPVDVQSGDPLGARVGAVPAALVLEHPGPVGHVEHSVVPGDPRVGHRDGGALVAADVVLGALLQSMRGAHRADQQRRCATRAMRHLNPHYRIPPMSDRHAPGSLHTQLVKSLGRRGVIRNRVNYNYSATFLRTTSTSVDLYIRRQPPDGGATMSYEPTQPMTPPSTSLADDGGEGPGRESQEDPGQDDAGRDDAGQQVAGQQDAGKQDAGQDDAAQAAAIESDSGHVTVAPEGGVSQATIPRAALSQASVPAPPDDAQPHAWGQGNGPQGDWASADGPQDDASQSDGPQSDGPQDDAPRADWGRGDAERDLGPQRGWGQASESQADEDQGNAQRDYEQHGYEGQAYGPHGYGPQGNWDRGNAEHGYGPQGYGPEGYGPRDYGPQDGPPPRPRRRRRPARRSAIAFFILLVVP